MSAYRSQVTAADFHPDTRAWFSGKRVVVTGGGGFIGSHVVEQLLELGARPVVPSRRGASPFLDHLGAAVEQSVRDLTDPLAARQALAGVDSCLHLAADVGGLAYNMAHPASIYDANMRLGMNVLAAAAAQGVRRVLLCSSACVYPRFCTIPTPETDGFVDEPEPTNGGYGWAKRMLEFLGRQYAAEFGLEVAIARPYNTYGPRDQFNPALSHVIPALIRKVVEAGDGEFEVWGDGSASRSFIYADDFARGLVEVAARLPTADPVNIGADEETTIADLTGMVVDIISQATGRSPRARFLPDKPAGQPRRHCDTAKAERLLDFRAKVPLRRGLESTIAWYLLR